MINKDDENDRCNNKNNNDYNNNDNDSLSLLS